MLIILSFKMKGELFKVWKNKKDAIQMVIFGLFGVGMNLYFYMLAVQHTNAPTATTLQYLSPTMIVIYTAIRNRKFPRVKEIIAVICALAGVFAISTHGNLHSLAITTTGLIIACSRHFSWPSTAYIPSICCPPTVPCTRLHGVSSWPVSL